MISLCDIKSSNCFGLYFSTLKKERNWIIFLKKNNIIFFVLVRIPTFPEWQNSRTFPVFPLGFCSKFPAIFCYFQKELQVVFESKYKNSLGYIWTKTELFYYTPN